MLILPHDVASMVAEFHAARSCLNIPQHAGHITRASDDLTIVDKPAATEIARMCAQLAGASDVITFFAVQVIDGTNIVKATASNEISRGGIGTGHDPAGAKWDSVDFVGGVCIPDDEFSVLRCRDKMSLVSGPMHSVYFSEMAPQGATCFHDDARQGVNLCSHGSD